MTLASVWPVAEPVVTRLPPDPVITSVLCDPLPSEGGAIGTASQAIAHLMKVVLGTPVGRAAIMQDAAGVMQSATVTPVAHGLASQSVSPPVQSASASAVKAGFAAQAVAPVAQSAGQSDKATASADQAVDTVMQSAAATAVNRTLSAQDIAVMAQAVQATPVASASAGQSLAILLQGVTASAVGIAGAAQTIAAVTQDAAGTSVAAGSADQAAGYTSQSAAATPVARGLAAQTAAGVTQSATGKPYRLWTPANAAATRLAVFDPATFTWSGSNFSGGTNSGSIGGAIVTALGTPTKAAGDANGHDAVNLPATAAFGIAAAALPAGNKVCVYVTKRLGNPANSLGALLSQSAQTPGWALYDQINTSGTLSNGHSFAAGDKGWNGWPSGTTNTDKDILVTPPADDGAYHLTVAKIGTDQFWRHDGAALTPNYATAHAMPAITGNLIVGTSTGGQNLNERLAYAELVDGDPSSGDIEKYEGWAAHRFGTVLPSGHPYETDPPTVF